MQLRGIARKLLKLCNCMWAVSKPKELHAGNGMVVVVLGGPCDFSVITGPNWTFGFGTSLGLGL